MDITGQTDNTFGGEKNSDNDDEAAVYF